MKIDRICINNFRSLKNVALNLDKLTMMIGANGTGKTAILDALRLFESEEANVVERDFNKPDAKIELVLVLSDVEKSIKAPEFIVKKRLIIKKTFEGGEGKPTIQCEVWKTCYSSFNEIRDAGSKPRPIKFKAIKKNFEGFPEYSAASWEEDLNKFEHKYIKEHPKDKSKYKGRFVNWKPSQMSLGDILEIVHVPAMKDITVDGEERADSNLTKLIDMAVRKDPEVKDHLEAIEGEFVKKYEDYLPKIHEDILDPINDNLEENTNNYTNNAKFTIGINLPEPKSLALRASITLTEDGHSTDIKHVGSGIQRIYLISILETIANQAAKQKIKKDSSRKTSQDIEQKSKYADPVKLIMIDEPELYQHPQRQRRILKQFEKLTNGKDTVQLICSTHSPYFIELQNMDNIRLFRKFRDTKVQSTALDHIIKYMDVKIPDVMDPEKRLRRWLDVRATHWATEGFFSKIAVVVEGPGDRNMLLAAASVLNVDLNKSEISIVPCNGKDEISRFAYIFMQFGIQVYLIWDLDLEQNDSASNNANHKLMELAKLLNYKGDSKIKPSINNHFSCFEQDLTTSLADDLIKYENLLNDNSYYKALKEARKRNAKSKEDLNENAKKDCNHSTSQKSKKPKATQKKVLDDKRAVYHMLEIIHEKDFDALKSFTISKVVYKLEELGKKLK